MRKNQVQQSAAPSKMKSNVRGTQAPRPDNVKARKEQNRRWRWNRRGLVPLALTVAIVAWALIYPMGRGGLTTDFSQALQAPSAAHIFGTDHYGSDLAVRVAEGLQISILMAVVSAVIATGLGTVIGLVAALSNPRVDAVLMRFTDAVAAIPHILVTIIIAASWRGSLTAIIVAIAITHWTLVARLIRAQTIAIRSSRYVSQAYSFGASRAMVAREHFWPEARHQVVISVALLTPHAVAHESILSFLGLGLPPTRASLGTLIGEAQTDLLLGAWWTWLAPSIVLVIFTLLILATLRAFTTREPLKVEGEPDIPSRDAQDVEVPARSPEGASQSVSGGKVADLDGQHTEATGHTGTTPTAASAFQPTNDSRSPVLVLENVYIRIPARVGAETGWIHAANGVNLTLASGRVHALAGESGCGKSTLARLLAGTLPPGTRTAGHAWISTESGPTDLVQLSQSQWQRVRGDVISMVPQGGAHLLNRTRTVRTHLEQVLKARGLDAGIKARHELLRAVHLDAEVDGLYPHQLSGGMAQRVNLALGIAGNPRVLVVDEPTAGLDPELAADIWGLLREQTRRGITVLAITHDLQMAEDYADDLTLMYAGSILETGDAKQVSRHPQSAYGKALQAARPDRGLVPVPGTPPPLFNLDPNHRFADRLRTSTTPQTHTLNLDESGGDL